MKKHLILDPPQAGEPAPIQASGRTTARPSTALHALATDTAPPALGPYSQAIRAGGMIYCAGQAATDPATGALVAGGIKEQTRQVLRNLAAVLESGGSSLDRSVKITVYLSDWALFKEMNEAYAEFFTTSHPPARSTVQGARWPAGHLVGMDVIAVDG
ncbi:MAG TPA: Rid family detoxifying hydrolase [Holophagaceae bacterium]|nr:Rid family detoxifying hydrolase [Holophagaceae bacterium]